MYHLPRLVLFASGNSGDSGNISSASLAIAVATVATVAVAAVVSFICIDIITGLWSDTPPYNKSLSASPKPSYISALKLNRS